MTGSASHLSFGWRSSQGWGRQKAPRLAACRCVARSSSLHGNDAPAPASPHGSLGSSCGACPWVQHHRMADRAPLGTGTPRTAPQRRRDSAAPDLQPFVPRAPLGSHYSGTSPSPAALPPPPPQFTSLLYFSAIAQARIITWETERGEKKKSSDY